MTQLKFEEKFLQMDVEIGDHLLKKYITQVPHLRIETKISLLSYDIYPVLDAGSASRVKRWLGGQFILKHYSPQGKNNFRFEIEEHFMLSRYWGLAFIAYLGFIGNIPIMLKGNIRNIETIIIAELGGEWDRLQKLGNRFDLTLQVSPGTNSTFSWQINKTKTDPRQINIARDDVEISDYFVKYVFPAIKSVVETCCGLRIKTPQVIPEFFGHLNSATKKLREIVYNALAERIIAALKTKT